MGKKISKTVEDYLKVILDESSFHETEYVSMGVLSRHMELTPGTVTTMVKRIAHDGWLEYMPRRGCRLTEEGIVQALQLLRKHRLVEFFLVSTLNMDWADVHQEAEFLEHSISDKVMERLDHFLGYPGEDPHGQPIFRSIEDYRSYSSEGLLTLNIADPGKRYRIIGVKEGGEHRPLLEYLKEHNLLPGTSIDIVSRSEGGGWLEIHTTGGENLKLGIPMGEFISVREESGSRT